MRRRKFLFLPLVSTVVLAAGVALVQPSAGADPQASTASDYLVLMKGTTVDATARKAIAKAGGTITEENSKLGYAYVRTKDAKFASKVSAPLG